MDQKELNHIVCTWNKSFCSPIPNQFHVLYKLNLTREKIMHGRGQLKTLGFLVLWPIYFLKKKVWKLFKCIHCLLCSALIFDFQFSSLSLSLTLFHCSVDICRWYYHYFVYQYQRGIHKLHSIKVFLFYDRAESLWLYHVETSVYVGNNFSTRVELICLSGKSFQILLDGAFSRQVM